MQDRYRCEMGQLSPRPEALERLYDMVEGGTEMKQTKRLSRRAAAILVCAVLTITAAAAAAIPSVWEGLLEQLGLFAPYAQTIDGAVCRDQGIEVQVLSALSDDLEARFYLSVRDVAGDRLNEHLTLDGYLENGREKEPEQEPVGGQITSTLSFTKTDYFQMLSYDPETRTALFSTRINYWNDTEPTRDARLSLTGMTTRTANMYAGVSCAGVTGRTLDSRPMGESDEIVFRPSDVDNLSDIDAAVPVPRVVLAPEQNPTPLEGTEDMWVSSMGFAGDGLFHVRLGLADGIVPSGANDTRGSFLSDLASVDPDRKWYAFHAVLLPDGLDILFPLVKTEDLEELKNLEARFYGHYTRPGTALEGSWNAEFQLEYHPSTALDWTGELAGQQVLQVTVSPLSVTMASCGQGGFSGVPLQAVMKDGSTVAARPGPGNYSNRAFGTGSSEPVWEAYNTWRFEEPVDLEELACLTLLDETIPVG